MKYIGYCGFFLEKHQTKAFFVVVKNSSTRLSCIHLSKRYMNI